MTESKTDAKLIRGLLSKLKSSGEAAFEELSNELMENELFLAAMKKSLEAKAHVDKTVSGTMDFMSLPSKNDVTKVLEEIEAIRSRLVKQQRILKNLEKSVGELKELLTQRPAE